MTRNNQSGRISKTCDQGQQAISIMSVLPRLICLMGFAAVVGCYQFPINQQAPIYRQQVQDRHQLNEIQRTVENQHQYSLPSSKAAQDSEAQQLRQLHQVVDSMAQMLNEEEQREAAGAQSSLLPNNYQRETQPQGLMSESAIRQAIEELELAQQREIQNPHQNQYSNAQYEAESRSRPVMAELESSMPEVAKPNNKQASLESLIEELGDELLDEQILSASQEAERLVQSHDSDRVSDKNQLKEPSQTTSDARKMQDDHIVSLKPTEMLQKQQNIEQQRASPIKQEPQQLNGTSTASSLFVGSLEPQESDLGSALTNDFYSFHSEQPAGSQVQRSSRQDQSSAQVENSHDSSLSEPQNDLDSAAQTRNSISQRETRPNLGSGRDQSTVRFDFTQPVLIDQNSRNPSHSPQIQDPHIRNARQHSGLTLEDPQYPTSTLLPNPDNFWKPSEGFGQGSEAADINQQYNRARSPQQTYPSLPPSRFQSLGPANQFLQPSAPVRQSSHTHFTGHSFIPLTGSASFSNSQPQSNERGSSSTSSPLISVLAEGDTFGTGNSVTWNPPSNIGTPVHGPSNVYTPVNQIPSTSTQNPDLANEFGPQQPPFAVSASKPGAFSPSQSAPQFANNVQSVNNRFVNSNKPSAREMHLKPSGYSSTEMSNAPEVTTDYRVEPTTIASQWPAPSSYGLPSNERDVSDSRPPSSVRSPSDERGFYPPNNPRSFSSTSSTLREDIPRTEQPRSSKLLTTTSSPPTTSSPSLSTPTTNSTKKDDMVIYYYYYYDDNKNATVVAKNISAGHSSIPLDAAIEADGGVEDTPYMDDPVPATNLIPSTVRPIIVTSTTPSALVSDSSLEEDSRSRFLANSVRIPVVSEPAPILKTSTARTPVREDPRVSSMKPTIPDQSRPSTSSRVPTQGVQRPSLSEQGGLVTSMPYNVPTSTTSSRARSQSHLDASANMRPSSTDLPPIRASSGARLDTVTQRNPPPSVPNSKMQNDLISNVLNSIPNLQPRPTSGTSTASTPVPSNAGNNRGPLSNASRYGTSNNMMIDPYGIDPAAPTSLSLLSHSHINTTSNLNHKNWSQHASHPSSSQQFGRKPIPTSSTIISNPSSVGIARDARVQESNQTRSNIQTTRNNEAAIVSSPRAANTNLTPVASRASSAQTSNGSSSSRQLYPESSKPAQPSDRYAPERIAAPAPKLTLPDDGISSTSNGQNQINRLISSSETPISFQKETLQRAPVANNGRPQTVDGNTSNGFTKSPIQILSSTSTSPSISEEQLQDVITEKVIPKIPPSPLPTIPPTMSTSVSRSFINPQGQVTTSVSPPTITTSSMMTTITQSSIRSEPVSPQTSMSVSLSNTTTSTESNQPTESPDTLTSATRKRFGNRNSRFQTRLNSLSTASPRSTSTTTPAPSSTTTTRRTVSTTTRKSSKQLFAGRRRLGSTQSDNEVTPSPSPSTSVNVSPSSSPSPSLDIGSSTSATARAKFGNSFTSRTKSTASPQPSSSDHDDSTPKSSLFATQRATPRPRLPFLKSTKQNQPQSTSTSDSSSTSPSQPIISEGSVQEGQVVNSDRSANEKLAAPNDSIERAEEVTDASLMRLLEAENLDKKEPMPNEKAKSEPIAAITTTPPPVSSSSVQSAEIPTGRNKPRVRPLFASRQRNTSLFGNRRNNDTAV